MTYIETIKMHGSSMTERALTERARRMARALKIRLIVRGRGLGNYALGNIMKTVVWTQKIDTIEQIIEELAPEYCKLRNIDWRPE